MSGSNAAEPRRLDVAVIGAGFSGVAIGIEMLRAGIDSFAIFDKANRPGGTWRENTYPGAACDAPSHLYQFSFEPNPDWSLRYAPQAEILAYLEHCIDKYGLRDHLRLGIEVTAVDFDANRGTWRVATTDGDWEALAVVAACGQLSRPSYPRTPGLDRFEGKWFHSARWDHDHDLSGRRVAVVGTGASAIQFVPAIAPQTARLHVFQRTPGWVLPKRDRAYSDAAKERMRRFPALQLASRFGYFAALEAAVPMFTGHPRARAMIEGVARRHLRQQVPDPLLRARLTPTFPIGCKRVLISSDWYPTLTRPNVELVTDGIREVTAGAIVTEDGIQREVDTIIVGTGFETGSFLFPVKVRGVDGIDLNQAWRNGAEAYLGLTVAGFPNLFIMYGPNTNLGAGSIIYMLESQTHYVISALETLRRVPGAYLDVRPQALDAFSAEVQERLAGSVWTGCDSWYRHEGGRITNNWPGFVSEYRRRTRRLDLADYRLVRPGSPRPVAGIQGAHRGFQAR
ncbi:MAG: NAD(P)/FAD-dependent oxidoreductase [Candidatus Dormiibacterota bacterium]